MKLASLFCVAALSLVGCADVETNGGGQGEGILPSKIAAANPAEKPFDRADVTSYQTKKLGSAPADVICEGCVMDSYSVEVDNSMFIDEVRVVSDGGMQLCRLYLSDGEVVIDECGINKP